jgi:hypothetical protein
MSARNNGFMEGVWGGDEIVLVKELPALWEVIAPHLSASFTLDPSA